MLSNFLPKKIICNKTSSILIIFSLLQKSHVSMHKLTRKACSINYLLNSSCLSKFKCHHTISSSFVMVATITQKIFNIEKLHFPLHSRNLFSKSCAYSSHPLMNNLYSPRTDLLNPKLQQIK